jgi:hypothetical protein
MSLEILLGGALAAIAAILAAFFKGRSDGRKAERDAQIAARLRSIQTRKGTDDEVDALGPDALRNEHARWLRDKLD